MYKQPEGKEVDVHGWEDRDVAQTAVDAGLTRFDEDELVASVPLLSARGLTKSFGGREILSGLDLELAAGAAHRRARAQRRRQVDAAAHPRRRGARRRRRRSPAAAGWCIAVAAADRRRATSATRSPPCSPRGPELAALEAELPRPRARIADPALAGDLDAMTRALAHQERLLAQLDASSAATAPRARRAAHLRALGLDDDALALPHARAVSGGQRKLVALAACLARRPDVLLLDEPEAHLDMAPPRRARARSLDDFDGAVADGLPRPPPARRVRRRHRRARPRRRSASGPAPTPPTPSRASSSSSASSSSTSRSRRRSRAWRRRSAASATGRTSRVNERAATQARVKQMQIDKMEKVERPVLERRKMALALRSGARGGQRVLALEGVDVALGDDPVLLDVELVVTRGERVGVVGPNGGGKTTLLRVLAGELEPRAGTRWVGDGIRSATSPRPPAACRDDAAGDRRAARRPLAGRGGRRAAADGASCSTTSRSGGRSRRCRGGERTRLAFLVPDAGRAELPRARRADQPPRHRLDRGARGRARALRRHGRSRSPTTATSSTASPTGSCSSPTARCAPSRAAGRRTPTCWRD